MEVPETLKERIILGIDPGTQVLGCAVLGAAAGEFRLLHWEGKKLDAVDYALKLAEIFGHVTQLIQQYCPDEMALEAPFYGKNAQVMLKLGRSQGVAMAAAMVRKVTITEYAPSRIKQAITGKGNASKEQVAHMLIQRLGIQDVPGCWDASDALAVALCHAQAGYGLPKRQGGSWKSFVHAHPERCL